MLKVDLSRENAVSFGLAALLPFLVHYGVSTFVPPPKFEDYRVKHYEARGEVTSKEDRINLETEQEDANTAQKAAERRFEERHFEVAVPVGLAALIVGSLISYGTVGTGLMYGGLFTFTEGMWGQWRELPDRQIFLLLLVAVFVIVIIGCRRWSEHQSESHPSPRSTLW